MLLNYLFNLLFFFVPLIFWPKTTEVFEFNKMLFVYSFTILIVLTWIIQMIRAERFIFKKTLLDKPLLVFLGVQLVSTFLSIDPHTSIFGYYSRFNGGLLSSIAYALLYWAFVTNLNKEASTKALKFFLVSCVLVSLYAAFEHFGASPSCLIITGKFDVACWVQDVQLRVFATIGQPNWLAAMLVAAIPFTWWKAFENFKLKNKKLISYLKNWRFWIWFATSLLLFAAIIFTKSRSGLLGLAIAFVTYWGLYLWKKGKSIKKLAIPLGLLCLSFAAITLVFDNPVKDRLFSAIKIAPQKEVVETAPTVGTQLESGGTESGQIRKIVWQGAINIWRSHPLFGTGLETFAYSYYQYRPLEHNLVSEWDFLYNKAHNEYLNYLANTGLLGFLSYLSVIAVSLLLIAKTFKKDLKLGAALMASYVSILVTNFFGFSVVIVALLFYLIPAFAVAANNLDPIERDTNVDLKISQLFALMISFSLALYLLILVLLYWRSDINYNLGKEAGKKQLVESAVGSLQKAIKRRPHEALYIDELAQIYTDVALSNKKDTPEVATQIAKSAIEQSNKALSLSPRNINLVRSKASVLIKLAEFDENYLWDTVDLLKNTIPYAPTDTKLKLHLGLSLARLGEEEEAEKYLKEAVKQKSNYKDARYALGVIYESRGDYQLAREQYEYILKNISPDDTQVQNRLDSIN